MPINCCQNTTATTTTTFLPVTSCCCSCSNPVEKPAMQKATIESRAMRDAGAAAAAAVANGQNGFLLCVGCHFIVHVAGDAAAWCLLQMLPLPQVLLPAPLLLLRHQIVRTRHKNRNRKKNEMKAKSAKREKPKSQFEPDCSLDYLWINEWMYIKHMMTIRGVKHPDKTLKYPESCL